MNIASLQQIDLHWREDGNPQGRPVVFVNSLGTDLRLWDAVLPLLPQSLRLIRFDNRGHGLSSCPNSPYSMEELVSDTEQFLDSLDIRDCLLVGLSIGGMIGQSLAVRRPDLIRAMVLSNTAVKMGEQALWIERIASIEAEGLEPMTKAILTRWFSPDFLGLTEAIAWRHMLQRTPLEGYTGCCHAIAGADLSAQSATLDLPVMGIAGSEDGASPVELVQATIDLIAKARCHVIEGVGHLPCIEKPADYASLLNSFITETGHV